MQAHSNILPWNIIIIIVLHQCVNPLNILSHELCIICYGENVHFILQHLINPFMWNHLSLCNSTVYEIYISHKLKKVTSSTFCKDGKKKSKWSHSFLLCFQSYCDIGSWATILLSQIIDQRKSIIRSIHIKPSQNLWNFSEIKT